MKKETKCSNLVTKCIFCVDEIRRRVYNQAMFNTQHILYMAISGFLTVASLLRNKKRLLFQLLSEFCVYGGAVLRFGAAGAAAAER